MINTVNLNGQYSKFDSTKERFMINKVILFLAAVIMLVTSLTSATPLDSIRIDYIDGKAYIIHQIDPGETLFAISKRYKSTMNAIAEFNPEVKKGLSDGMILQIPYNAKAETYSKRVHIVAEGETLYSISNIYDISVIEIMEWNDLLSSELEVGQELIIVGKMEAQPIDFVRDGLTIHIVQAGEGLFAVARNYNVSIDDLVAWNNLETSVLNLGQQIIVSKGVTEPPIVEHIEEQKPAGQAEPIEQAAITYGPPVAKVRRNENGLAASIEGEDEEKSFLALHREISIGSLVVVRNEMNNQVVFVRIVGKLPDTGINDKVIIRMSKAAILQLQAIDPKFRVEISYLVPRE